MNAKCKRVARGLAWAIGASMAMLTIAYLWLSRGFDPPPWPPGAQHPPDLYDLDAAPPGADPSRPLIPFELAYDPMRALLLVNFEGDPDDIYLGLEPQRFDDDVHGRGLLVIGWRVDGRVDVFHTPGLRLDPATYGIAGGGLHRMVERRFERDRLDLGPDGAQVDISFLDLEERPVRIRIEERDPGPRRPFALLAPMGDAAERPPALPLVYLHRFDFVRIAGSEVLVELGGRARLPDRMPLPLHGARVYFMRYSPDPLILTLNPAANGPLPHRSEAARGQGPLEGHALTPVWATHGAITELAALERQIEGRRVRLEFSPPFVHLGVLADGAVAEGRFRLIADPTTGVVGGAWRVARRGDTVDLTLRPTDGWTPAEPSRMVRLIYRMGGVFLRWPKTYEWSATIQLPSAEGDAPTLRSGWRRTPE